MQKGFVIAAMAAFLATTSFMAPSVAIAKSDKASKAQAQDCKKIADPKKKDECVSNAKNKQERGKGMSTKGDKASQKDMDKAKGKKK